MIKFKLFDNFNMKKKIALIALLIFALLIILGNYVIKSNIEPADLKGKVMADVDLRYANLDGADVSNADLRRSNLSGVDLRNTVVSSHSNANGEDLKNTNLSKADLSNTKLRGVDLTRVNLSYSNLSGADLSNTNLNNADLTGVDLSNTNLSGADLRNANLSSADLRNKDLTGVILFYANLSNTNLTGVDLSNKDLTGVDLTGVNLSNKDLNGTILRYANLSNTNLTGVDLSNKDLTGVNLSKVDLSNKDLTGTILRDANLTDTNLTGVDLSNKDLTGVNLSKVDLSNKDLTGTILRYANLTDTNLTGVDLTNKDLTGVNLSEVDLSNKDLTGTILKDVKKIEINIENPSNSNWPATNEIQKLNISRYALGEDVQYISTIEGFLLEFKNNESRLVVDLKKYLGEVYPNMRPGDRGITGVAFHNNLVYISYSIEDINGEKSLMVDEFSMNFTKARNIIKIEWDSINHISGNLSFDSFGRLYLAVGDGDVTSQAQNLNSLLGKIIRLDVSELKLEPEIVAYGLREPWGVHIDSRDRMFISQCGKENMETVFFLDDLYSDVPTNFGWPIFEGSQKLREGVLMFEDVSGPIYETNIRPGCMTAGVYLDDFELFLFGDYFGTIGLLKQKENGDWYLLHKYKQKEFIWGFGLDKKTKKIFIAPNNLELEILVEQVNLN